MKLTRALGIDQINELGEEGGDREGEPGTGVSNKGPGGGSSSMERALAKNTEESGAAGYSRSLQTPSTRHKSSGLRTRKCMKTRKRTMRCPSKSLPSHSPTISKELTATQRRTSIGPSQSSP
jgi:hypothetical protein